MALLQFEAELCHCGFHRSVAWHPDMGGGWFETRSYLCHACTAIKGEDVTYDVAVDVRDGDDLTLREFSLDDALVDAGDHIRRPNAPKEVDASVG